MIATFVAESQKLPFMLLVKAALPESHERDQLIAAVQA
jgi:hypothetical protein